MDSLTQVVLGAAVGEAVLGKKIGNRAILWGAIAGTIPDLDVAANAFLSPVDALAFHRGITHSFVFSILGALTFGWILHIMYRFKHHKYVAAICWALLLLSVVGAVVLNDTVSIVNSVTGIILLALGVYFIYFRYNRRGYSKPDEVTVREWQWLFFWSLVTHPILDCFTTYGTQMLLPFSDYRIGFNNISVADPLYTVPFMLFLIAAMFFKKENKWRRILNIAGITISSLYMSLTFYNKTKVNEIFMSSLQAEGIRYNRYMTTPTILNNVLWYGVAESDSAYHYGHYSFFDKEKSFKLNSLPKDEQIRNRFKDDRTLDVLKWFSNDYYNLTLTEEKKFLLEDLRFGTFRTSVQDSEKFVFRFSLRQGSDGKLELLTRGDGPKDANFKEMFSILWRRIMGEI